MVFTPTIRPNMRGSEGSEQSDQLRRDKLLKMRKVSVYGKTFGMMKKIAEDAVFHPVYPEHLSDLAQLLEEFEQKIQSMQQGAQGMPCVQGRILCDDWRIASK